MQLHNEILHTILTDAQAFSLKVAFLKEMGNIF